MANQAALIRNVVADVLMGSMKTASALSVSGYSSKNTPAMVAEFGSSNCPYWHIEGFVCPYAVYSKRSGLFFIHG